MAEPDLAESHLLGWLSTVGLDAHYVRAEGDYLYRLDERGREIPVVDFAGGYGSLMFGHNHPEIVALAQQMLTAQAPVHAQFSRHPYATELAARLTAVVQRETGEDGTYNAVFANSGAEAVEIAVKHAELDRALKVAELQTEIAEHLESVRAAVTEGTAAVPDEVARVAGLGTGEAGPVAIDRLIAHIDEVNAARAGAEPLLFALEGGFHGKLMGSVQLTHNAAYRTPFAALGTSARFVTREEIPALPKIFEEERVDLLDLAVSGNEVAVVHRRLPLLCAFVLEPIQGEGGIRLLDSESAATIQSACAEADVPIVVDEVQSGMGRTGTFLASTGIGLRGDYYALAKSLGGGIAKAAVMLARSSRYRPQFELVHSSTFAKDYFSTTIGLKVLDLLEADDGAAYRKAAERGAHLLDMLRSVQRDFPDVVRDVRGRGLMAGLEFHDQSGSEVEGLRQHAEGATLGYALAGKLLRSHRVRTFPTASSPNTLRFEPSIHIGDKEVAQLEAGLREVCALLRAQDGPGLLEITPAA
ncbi:aspartate aminotransferase family protein [Streptomyces lancefieldiae]|uniref:Aminotransferase class III-fold pyridoxal phosphate-dependent enzyme n=1 Tax=Streptomyces lancefieldiae TaxID=3075520 RepID=A0ABU3AYX7_9ACTN|nr:aminotransferase class III-fold pyridoxal phosphate-dependent enzyme [Streptomyces sp. DSM 40712]MDT0615399.1 aminotransferase class III-fold pyridoxal phosphate-dependent enzyme [Streptomyces sp. DSM 40712]